MRILEIFADIGGTNSRFEIITKTILKKSYLNSDFSTFTEMLVNLFDHFNLDRKREIRMCFGIAAPIVNNEAHMSNIDWLITQSELNIIFPNCTLFLINDLEAVGYYIANSNNLKYLPVKSGSFKRENNNFMVVGLGTGFGLATGIDRDPSDKKFAKGDEPIDITRSYLIRSSEAGHVSFSPKTKYEKRLFNDLLNGNKILTIEDVCSSIGIENIYYHMTDDKNDIEDKYHRRRIRNSPDVSKAVIKHSKGRQKCEICQYVVKYMVEILANKLIDLSLEFLPYQGIFLHGGITMNIISFIMDDEFNKIFKGRNIIGNGNTVNNIKIMLKKIPIYILTDDNIGLIGARYYMNSVLNR